MTEPIPAEVMEEARKAANGFWDTEDGTEAAYMAAIILAAEKRGEQQERERCAKIVEDEDGKYSWAGEDRHARLLQQHSAELASAIRSPT